jgi:hypothetical protein
MKTLTILETLTAALVAAVGPTLIWKLVFLPQLLTQ